MPLALISLQNKEGVEGFAKGLSELGWQIIASAGTAAKIAEAGIPVTDVADWVGGGPTEKHLVATLSRPIHIALSSQNDEEIKAAGATRIDLLCVGLYDQGKALNNPSASRQDLFDNMDIGGPAMATNAAKNGRIVLVDRNDWAPTFQKIQDGTFTDGDRDRLADKALFTVGRYRIDAVRFLSNSLYDGIVGRRVAECKYGENAWQTPAALYTTDSDDPLALDKFKLVAGTPPSYNNYCDVDRMLITMSHIAAAFDVNCGRVPAIAIGVKHGNPCGAGEGIEVRSSWEASVDVVQKMVDGDKRALFGGFVMLNFPVGDLMAELLLTYNTEERRILDGVVAPDFSDEAIAHLRRKGDKCRFLVNPALAQLNRDSLDRHPRFRYVRGGFVTQPNYTHMMGANWSCAEVVVKSLLDLTPEIIEDMILAEAIGCSSNSNTVTLVKKGELIGNGVGQQDRVSCCKLAIARALDAGHDPTGAVAYSDSFFPFPDGPETLAKAGIKAILATSGSVKDAEVKKFCRDNGIILVLYPDVEARGFFGH